MAVSRLRLEKSSLFHYIKDQVVATAFLEQRTTEALVYSSSLDEYVALGQGSPSPVSEGRGWAYFDDSTVNGKVVVDTSQEQTSKVNVYNSSDVLIDPSNYNVNYKRGSIIHVSGDTPAKVSYQWHYVSVIPSWPGTTPPPLPLVSMDVDFSQKEGFQLGPGVKNIRTAYFNIFCTSPQERDDLSELIHDSLHDRRVIIYDYSSGDFIERDGTFDTSVMPLVSIGSMFFDKVMHRNVYVSDDFSDLYKYRSEITGTYESLVEVSTS